MVADPVYSGFADHRLPVLQADGAGQAGHRELRAAAGAPAAAHTLHLSGQFASTMATMLASGLPVQTVLGIVSQISDNYVFSLGVRKVKEGVERGRGIADSMEGVECFPKMLTEMVAVGERSGSLEETLDVIGDYFDHEAATMTERLLAVLEPVIIIVLAAVTVILLLAVYLPMFSMYGSI